MFGGQPIEGGDESLPAFPLHRHPDTYSRTKALAEQVVLAANLTPLPAGGHLRTCVVRPAGKWVWGGTLLVALVRRRDGRHTHTPGCRPAPASFMPAGIYGPGEQRHLPRVVSCLEAGLFCFTYGDAVVDFVHVRFSASGISVREKQRGRSVWARHAHAPVAHCTQQHQLIIHARP